MRWTRLSDSLLAQAAKPLYTEPRRVYHTLGHLERMFFAAEAMGLAYDKDLDEAIWGHDAIMDPLGENESRSCMWLLSISPSSTKAGSLIMTTKRHVAGPDNRLLILDLYDFMDETQCKQNTLDLIEEGLRMGAPDKAHVLKGMDAYLTRLSGHLNAGLSNDLFTIDEQEIVNHIEHGVQETIKRLPSLA